MENLWPKHLFGGAGDNEIEQFLVAQADGIWERSKGLVIGTVQDRSVAPGRAWSLGVHPTGQPTKKTDLLVIRSEHGDFPAAIQTFYADQPQFRRVRDAAEMRSAFKTILGSPETKEIVEILRTEAISAGAVLQEPSKRKKVSDARSFLIGKIVKTKDREFAHVALAGAGGFVEAEKIRQLMMEPDEPGSPIQTLGDGYVVTIEFLGSFKLTLSAEELNVLKAEAKKSVS